jgi:hypothetical protein
VLPVEGVVVEGVVVVEVEGVVGVVEDELDAALAIAALPAAITAEAASAVNAIRNRFTVVVHLLCVWVSVVDRRRVTAV